MGDSAERIHTSALVDEADSIYEVALYADGDVALTQLGRELDAVVLEPTHLEALSDLLEDGQLPSERWVGLGADTVGEPIRAASSGQNLTIVRGQSEDGETIGLPPEGREAFEEWLDDFEWVYRCPDQQ